ncbi:hypothetical protein EDD22DRAFT_866348 [Suillus occidentalis]|nr:hypothetical protein EDD22DRAFT_866348 [Suillus occidentalis]
MQLCPRHLERRSVVPLTAMLLTTPGVLQTLSLVPHLRGAHLQRRLEIQLGPRHLERRAVVPLIATLLTTPELLPTLQGAVPLETQLGPRALRITTHLITGAHLQHHSPPHLDLPLPPLQHPQF